MCGVALIVLKIKIIGFIGLFELFVPIFRNFRYFLVKNHYLPYFI